LRINSYLNPNLFIENTNILYTDYRLDLGTAVLDIPFALTLNLALENTKINRSRSGIQFNLDTNHFAQKLRDKYIDLASLKHHKLPNLNPSIDELLHHQENILYQSYKELITSVKWQNLKTKLGSYVNESSSSEIDSLANLVVRVEQRYAELWKKKIVTTDSIRLSLDSKINQLREHYTRLNNPDYIKEFLPLDSLKAFEKMMMYTQKLNIGLFTLSENELLIRHRLLKGGEYAMKTKKWSFHLAHGREHLQEYLGRNILNTDFNPYQISYAKVGNEEEGFKYYFAMLAAAKQNQNDDLWNRVLSLGGEQHLGRNQSLSLDIAYSQFSSTQAEQNEEDPIAMHLKWRLANKSGSVKTSLGYFRIGEHYESVGNPFLFTNREGVSFSLEGNIFKNRLNIQVESKYGNSINQEEENLMNWQLSGRLNYTLNNNINFGGSYMPNIFQAIDAVDITNQKQNIYSAYAQFHNSLGDNQWMNLVNYSNLRSGFSRLDSIEVGKSGYLNLQSNLIAANNNSLNLMLNKEWYPKGDIVLQLDYKWIKNDFQLGTGAQYLGTSSENRRYGLIAHLGINKPKFSLGVNTIYWIDRRWTGYLSAATRI
ncbi:MAG: hypothetical protein AAFP82_20025, partial [Bacteroidota bacterium]